jgi:hypothetical protein
MSSQDETLRHAGDFLQGRVCTLTVLGCRAPPLANWHSPSSGNGQFCRAMLLSLGRCVRAVDVQSICDRKIKGPNDKSYNRLLSSSILHCRCAQLHRWNEDRTKQRNHIYHTHRYWISIVLFNFLRISEVRWACLHLTMLCDSYNIVSNCRWKTSEARRKGNLTLWSRTAP